MTTIRDALKAFLSSPAFKLHLKLAPERATDAARIKGTLAAYIRGEEGIAGLATAVRGTVSLQVEIGGIPSPVWGFGGPGTAKFFDALVDAADATELDTSLRRALTGVNLHDPADRLREFAIFVADVARAAKLGPESNLHIGYATCFLTFCWHVLYDLQLPVFYGASHKGMKQLLVDGVVQEPDYASRDLARRFRAFLKVTAALHDLLCRVNPKLTYWTVDGFLDWFSQQAKSPVEDSRSMARPEGMVSARSRRDAMATMATIDPAVVAAAVALQDDERGATSGPASSKPAWYEGRVQTGTADAPPPPPPPPPPADLDGSALPEIPLQPAGSAPRTTARQVGPDSSGQIPGLQEYVAGEKLLDSTSGIRAPRSKSLSSHPEAALVSAAFPIPLLAERERSDTEGDLQEKIAAAAAGPAGTKSGGPAHTRSGEVAHTRSGEMARTRSGEMAAPPDRGTALDGLERSTLLARGLLEDIWTVLETRGRIALEGPTGTGKSHAARALAAAFTGTADTVRVVQLHPSYRYDDLVEAAIPGTAAGSQGAVPGVFKAFADSARRSPGQRYALVLDDLDRVDGRAVLGECLALLEDRRAIVTLPHSRTGFALPPNLYLIATLGEVPGRASLDPSLRRRLPSVRLQPDPGLVRRFLAEHAPDMQHAADLLEAVNDRLADRPQPIAGLGHTPLLRADLDENSLRQVWLYEILPALRDRIGREADDGMFDLAALQAAASKG